MIVPCIDLQGGAAVQLVGGRRRALVERDVFGLLRRFAPYPTIHVIDLDAAMRRGSNWRLVRALCRAAPQRRRVGGGIRTVRRARRVLGWGANQVIIGSAAFAGGQVHHAFLGRLARAVGRRRVVVALDASDGRLVIGGWRRRLPLLPQAVMPALEPYCAAFLCTCVHREGRLRGTDLAWFRSLIQATHLPLIAAGGISTRAEVRALERLGMDAAVGMALYRNRLR